MYNTYTYKEQVQRFTKMCEQGIPVTIIDLETTGRSANNNFIFQFAGIKINIMPDLRVVKNAQLCVFMKPEEPLSPKITEITGFTNEDLEGKPSESEVFKKIMDFMDGSIMCSHNTTFEKNFMSAMYQRNGEVFDPIGIIDTLKMDRDLHKEEKSHKLGDIAERYGIADGVAFHDARNDAIVCAKLLIRFLSEYEDLVVPNESEKLKAHINSISFWKGKRHDQTRLYINTNYGTVWWSTFNRMWGEKDKGIISAIDMFALESQVLTLTKCKNFDELAKFKGAVKCTL